MDNAIVRIMQIGTLPVTLATVIMASSKIVVLASPLPAVLLIVPLRNAQMTQTATESMIQVETAFAFQDSLGTLSRTNASRKKIVQLISKQ